MDRRQMLGWLLACIVLMAFAAMQSCAIRDLQTQVRQDAEAREKIERDRFFLLRQDIQLQGAQTRSQITETCRP